MVETIFDTLNAKAALYAVEEVFDERGSRLPVMISGTITDGSGRTLSGQTAEAFFYLDRADGRPLSVGLNCALGAQRPAAARGNAGAAIADSYVFDASERRPAQCVRRSTTNRRRKWPPRIREFAAVRVASIIVGGCCGTSPAHIRAIADAVAG